MLQLEDLTPNQFREICNGIGPKGYAYSFLQFHFVGVADHHDLDYYVGGNVWDKCKADWKFFTGCLSVGWHDSLTLEFSVAFLYYIAVTLGGWFCFNFGKKKTMADVIKDFGPE